MTDVNMQSRRETLHNSTGTDAPAGEVAPVGAVDGVSVPTPSPRDRDPATGRFTVNNAAAVKSASRSAVFWRGVVDERERRIAEACRALGVDRLDESSRLLAVRSVSRFVEAELKADAAWLKLAECDDAFTRGDRQRSIAAVHATQSDQAARLLREVMALVSACDQRPRDLREQFALAARRQGDSA